MESSIKTPTIVYTLLQRLLAVAVTMGLLEGTSATSERGKGIFSKITFLKSVHIPAKKMSYIPALRSKIFTKSLHRGGGVASE